MKNSIIACIFLLSPIFLLAQTKELIQETLQIEHDKGRFNGTLLYADGKELIKVNKGYSNFQFQVKINQDTRFPIASITKLFTSIALLKLQENGALNLNDKASKYVSGLPKDCRNITIKDLLLHQSGLENEPIKAVTTKYNLNDYLTHFLKRFPNLDSSFNYNNVDYILLSKIIENITKEDFEQAIEKLILDPLDLKNTGFVKESDIIPNLAYGYHNYSFGEGSKDDPLYNDSRYLSNYYGAGAMYSTTEDLYKFIDAIKNNLLLTLKTKNQLLLSTQNEEYIDWLSGKPTLGFFYDETDNTYRRSGSIDGFNSSIIISKDFNQILIILCNTDTANLENLALEIFKKASEK